MELILRHVVGVGVQIRRCGQAAYHRRVTPKPTLLRSEMARPDHGNPFAAMNTIKEHGDRKHRGSARR